MAGKGRPKGFIPPRPVQDFIHVVVKVLTGEGIIDSYFVITLHSVASLIESIRLGNGNLAEQRHRIGYPAGVNSTTSATQGGAVAIGSTWGAKRHTLLQKIVLEDRP